MASLSRRVPDVGSQLVLTMTGRSQGNKVVYPSMFSHVSNMCSIVASDAGLLFAERVILSARSAIMFFMTRADGSDEPAAPPAPPPPLPTTVTTQPWRDPSSYEEVRGSGEPRNVEFRSER